MVETSEQSKMAEEICEKLNKLSKVKEEAQRLENEIDLDIALYNIQKSKMVTI